MAMLNHITTFHSNFGKKLFIFHTKKCLCDGAEIGRTGWYNGSKDSNNKLTMVCAWYVDSVKHKYVEGKLKSIQS